MTRKDHLIRSDFSSATRASMIENFPSLSPVDRAVMAADAQLSDQLALFYHDHRRALEMPLTSLLLFLIVPLITASAVLLWLFDG